MSKYASCVNLNERCKMELEEAKAILDSYSVLEDDRKTILGMIIEPYFQLSEACASARAMDKLFAGKRDWSFRQYMDAVLEEQKRYPFDVTLEEEDETM